jgi:general secretion pathway protein K
MNCAPQQAGEQPRNGFIIVAVLWILGALATLAVIYALYVNETVAASFDHNERLQAEALVTSGVELAVYRLTQIPGRRPIQGRFSFRQGNAAVSVAFACENGRIDLNFAPREMLAGLFIGLGADSQAALNFADRIIGWRKQPFAGQADAEAAFYQDAGKNYGPRHGPFQSIDELALVVGMPQQFVDRALPYLTVYSGRGEVNVLGAPSAVIAALPGMTPDRLQLLLSERDTGVPQDVMRAQLGMSGNYVTLQPSAANRITVDMRFTSGRRMRAEAVVLALDNDTEPYRVLYWRDQELSADAVVAGLR